MTIGAGKAHSHCQGWKRWWCKAQTPEDVSTGHVLTHNEILQYSITRLANTIAVLPDVEMQMLRVAHDPDVSKYV